MVTFYGIPFSAHTRKVLILAREKHIAHELVPLVPLAPDLPELFLKESPLRKIPLMIHDGLAVADSSVIALYLDRVFPERPMHPVEPAAYARSLFIEELVDGALAPHVLRGLLFQRVFGPGLLGLEPDEALIETSLREKIPQQLAILESSLDGDWFAGTFSYADITVVSMLLNFFYAGEVLDRGLYPKLGAHLERVLARDSFREHLPAEIEAAREVPGLSLKFMDGLGV